MQSSIIPFRVSWLTKLSVYVFLYFSVPRHAVARNTDNQEGKDLNVHRGYYEMWGELLLQFLRAMRCIQILRVQRIFRGGRERVK